ncbi:MAG: ATP-binding cassette domain-containing protein [Phycisphaerales bacterium]|nr:MAG: ATP-binding cassette domain-containing protein [Phycisphaerales bacterium]
MTNDAIAIDNVSKTFGEHRAVDDLSLRVPEGSIYGFIGPNGSGKTTTLRMIMGIYYPDPGSGSIRVLGEALHGADNDAIGYLPEERGLYRKMKVRDLLRFYLELKGRREFKGPIDDWLARLDLTGWAHRKIQELSKGMAQKVQFISAVIHEPRLVILDEPFSGLDPVNADVIRDAIVDLRRKGTTVVFSTHDMSVAEKMCDYVFMIFKGRKVLDGTLDSIQRRYGHDTIRVRLDQNGAALNQLTGVERVTDFGRLQELRLADGADTQDVLTQLMQHGRVAHFEITQPSLHDIFVRIARPEPQETAGA